MSQYVHIKEILARLFQRVPILLVTVCISQSQAWAQDHTIQGHISDLDGEDVIGATILEKGTNNGTITDIDGNFQLQVSAPDAVLDISFVGFESQQIPLNGRTSIEVQMRPSLQQMQEVVVTALGIEKDKKSLGYSSQSVEGDELVTAKEINVINSLSGRVSGVQINQAGTGPGGTSKVVIRGYASISSSNTPLYVVDGIPMTNSQGGGGQFGGIDYGDGISNINPEDIASINVLKGASATSLYGSRGQNGVIMITTKKGSARKGIGVALSSNFTIETPLVLPEFQNRFGRGSNGQLPLSEDGKILNGIRTSWGARTLDQTEFNGLPIVNWTGEQVPYSAQPDNIRDFFRTGYTNSNSVAFSGGNEKIQSRVSITQMHRENIMPNSNMDRVNVSMNINAALTERLNLDGRINYINQKFFNRPNLTLSPDNPMKSLIEMPRNIRLEDLKNYRTATGLPRVYTNATGNDTWQNPYWAVNLNTNNDERDRLLGYMKLEYRLTDWLKVHARTGTDFYNDFRQNRSATNTIYRVSPDKSYYSEAYVRVQETNSDVLFTVSLPLSTSLQLSGNVGGNILEVKSRGLSNIAQGLNIPDFFVMQNALSVVSSESASLKKVHSVYGSAQLDYSGFWFVDVAARNDWSSALPPSNWSYFYPSVSSSLVLSEAFNMDWGTVNFAKLRGSWAQVGNDTGPYQLDMLYVVNSLSHGGQTFGQVQSTQPPVNLKPERTNSFEVGVELGFWENRLSLDLTYYNAGTYNQIWDVPVSKPSGFDAARINAGLINNQGIEASLNAKVIDGSGFFYETYINFTRNRSEVREIPEEISRYPVGAGYDQFGVRILSDENSPFGDIYADRSFLRDEETGKVVVGNNGLPLPDPDGLKKIGNYQPDFLAGFGHRLTYNSWNLHVLLDIRKGGDIFSFTNAVAAANGNAEYTEDNRLEWYAGAGGYVVDGIRLDGSHNTIEVNPQTYYQFVGGRASAFAEEFIYDGSFIKLREVSLGYQVPSTLLKNTFIERASLSLVGRNLAILFKNTVGFDPEATFNAGNDQGIEAYAFPSTSSYGINLNIAF